MPKWGVTWFFDVVFGIMTHESSKLDLPMTCFSDFTKTLLLEKNELIFNMGKLLKSFWGLNQCFVGICF
jgi:hypothetical protein